jgi:predicted alpha/beta-fold hydrolase
VSLARERKPVGFRGEDLRDRLAAIAGLRPELDQLERVVAVCPVLDPAHTLVRLESGWALYRQYFVWKWHRSLKKKQAAWPQAYDLGPVQALDNLTDMTDHLVRTYGGYPSLQQYLQGYAIVGDALGSIAHPTRIISAADDPIIPVEDLDRVARPAALTVAAAMPAHGPTARSVLQ